MKLLTLWITAVMSVLSVTAWGQSYTVTDLGVFRPRSINDAGIITGITLDSAGNQRGALWQNGAVEIIEESFDLLDANDVHAVGTTSIEQPGGLLDHTAFRATFDGTILPLAKPPAAVGTFATTISTVVDGREMTGGYMDEGLRILPGRWFSDQTVMELLQAPEGGGAVNTSNAMGQTAGFVKEQNIDEVSSWSYGGVLTRLGNCGATFAFANDINDAGVMVGECNLADGRHVPFKTQGNSLVVLPMPPGFLHSLEAFAINTAGEVVGTAHLNAQPNSRNFRALLWDTNGMPSDLNAAIPQGTGWILTHATGLTDDGRITGYGFLNDESRGFLLTPDTPRGLPSLALSINQANFTPGQHLDTTLVLSNPGPQRQVDMYVGIVFPDGWVWWVKDVNTFEGTASDSLEADPSTFTSLWPNMTLIAGLNATWTDFIEHTWTGLEGAGTYHLVVGWTAAGSLADGVINEGDLLALDWKAFRVVGGAVAMNR